MFRRSEQGHLIDASLLRGFARAALVLDAAQDQLNDLLFEHVVGVATTRRSLPIPCAQSSTTCSTP